MYKTLNKVANFFDKGLELSKKDLADWFTPQGIRCLEKDGYIESQITNTDFKNVTMEVGRIYFIAFGENTQLIVRLRKKDSMHYHFYSCLHYWNGSESFKRSDYCQRSGITGIREASKAEKHRLFEMELELDMI